MKALVQRHSPEELAVVGVNTDHDPEEYRRQKEKHGVTWRSAWQGSTGGPIPRAWGIDSYPTIFVLDREHVIRHVNPRGYDLERVVDALVAEKENARPAEASTPEGGRLDDVHQRPRSPALPGEDDTTGILSYATLDAKGQRFEWWDERREPISLRVPLQTGRVAAVRRTEDSSGRPAITFDLAPEDAQRFSDFTEEHAGERMAVLAGGRIAMVVTVGERLPGRGLLRLDEEEDVASVLAWLSPPSDG